MPFQSVDEFHEFPHCFSLAKLQARDGQMLLTGIQGKRELLSNRIWLLPILQAT